MQYLDTSILVAALTIEEETPRVQQWLGECEAIVTSDWVIAEFSAALSIKLRRGTITSDERAKALGLFMAMAVETMRKAEIGPNHFRRAARLADEYATGLRAGDALHLAIAERARTELCTLDVRQAEAGAALGIRARLV